MSEACRVLSTPVIGGNVSLYNETKGEAIFPTRWWEWWASCGILTSAATQGFKDEGDVIILLGVNKGEIGGSGYWRWCTVRRRERFLNWI
jgi:phosphoribosylformylglycinamidine synthase